MGTAAAVEVLRRPPEFLLLLAGGGVVAAVSAAALTRVLRPGLNAGARAVVVKAWAARITALWLFAAMTAWTLSSPAPRWLRPDFFETLAGAAATVPHRAAARHRAGHVRAERLDMGDGRVEAGEGRGERYGNGEFRIFRVEARAEEADRAALGQSRDLRVVGVEDAGGEDEAMAGRGRAEGQDVDVEAQLAQGAIGLEHEAEIGESGALRLHLPRPGGGVVEDQRDGRLRLLHLRGSGQFACHLGGLGQARGGVGIGAQQARMVLFLTSDDAAMCSANNYMVEAGSI